MPVYLLDPVDGETVVDTPQNYNAHSIDVDPAGATGTLVIEAMYQRGGEWQDIPNGTVDLSDPTPFFFNGPVDWYRFTLINVTGSAQIRVTESSSAGSGYSIGYGSMRKRINVTGTSEPIWLPRGLQPIAVGLYPVESSRVEYTISARSDIAEDTAVWLVWPLGEVAEPSVDTLNATVTALRVIGDATLEVATS